MNPFDGARRAKRWFLRLWRIDYSHDPEVFREQRFWMGMVYAALAGYGAVICTILGYVYLSWSAPNRGWIIFGALSGLLFILGFCALRPAVIDARPRLVLFSCSNIASFGFVLALCALDGGLASPMANLLILPMVYLAIGYPLGAVLVCGATALAGTAVLAWASAHPGAYSPLLLQGVVLSNGWLLAVIGATIRDRNDRKLRALRQRLEKLAETDDLTGCLNQRAFLLALNREVARAARYGHAVSLLLIDVDYFKRINDRDGHMMGDEVLRQLGEVLRDTVRHADIAGRPGGDELAVLAPGTKNPAAYALAARIQNRVKAHAFPVAMTLSIGVCTGLPAAGPAAMLFRRADRALYAAKRRGRNQIAIGDSDTDAIDCDPEWARVS